MQLVGRFGFHIEIRRSLSFCRCNTLYGIAAAYCSAAFLIYRRSGLKMLRSQSVERPGGKDRRQGLEARTGGKGWKQGLEARCGGVVWRRGVEAWCGGVVWRRGVEAWRMCILTGRLCALPNLRPRTSGSQGTQRHICVA
jgi:hypothetical protein